MGVPTILLVEDETDVLMANQQWLEAEGYRVMTAETVKKAAELMRATAPDLIVLDILLPDGSGLDFCAEIRKTTAVPVLFLTCLGAQEDIVKGLLLGGDDYLTKPHDLAVLSARIFALLRRSGLQSAGIIELPPLSLNLRTGKATLEGRSLLLTQKELQILSLFMSREGEELSAEEIYQAVWDEKIVGGLHTVTTHISALRKKIISDHSPFDLRPSTKGCYIFEKNIY